MAIIYDPEMTAEMVNDVMNHTGCDVDAAKQWVEEWGANVIDAMWSAYSNEIEYICFTEKNKPYGSQ